MDAIVQALSGLMLTSGAAHEGPVRVGVPFADLVAPLFGVIGILSALNQRQRTGTGQFVDVSMLGALTALVANEPFELLERCGVPARTGSTVPRLAPFGVYPTRDGSIAICAPTEVFARGVFAAIGLPDLTGNGKFATRDARVENVGELNTLIERYTSTKPTDELVATFERHGGPVAPVRAPADAVRDVRVQKRGETVELAHRRYGSVDGLIGTGVPIVFSDAITGFAEPAPALGEHNDFVYGQLLGYTQERIRDLKNSGAI
jgi:crotonobetainyl-CoA:carnitine CoA-transferase CaiB-like acyl-CoA transferase